MLSEGDSSGHLDGTHEGIDKLRVLSVELGKIFLEVPSDGIRGLHTGFGAFQEPARGFDGGEFKQSTGDRIRIGAELVEREDENPIGMLPLTFGDSTMDEAPVPKRGVRGEFQTGILEDRRSPELQLLLIATELPRSILL